MMRSLKLFSITLLFAFLAISESFAATAPTIQARYLTFTSITKTTARLAWINGNGSKRIVVASTSNIARATIGAALSAVTEYSDNNGVWTGAPQVGATGAYVLDVVSGSARISDLSGLSGNGTYYTHVFEYNVDGGGVAYNIAVGTNNPRTLETGILEPTTLQALVATATSRNVTWEDPNSPDATSYLIDVATDAGFTSFVPGYNSLSVLVFPFEITGLTAQTQYYFRVRAVSGLNTSANSVSLGFKTGSTPPALVAGGPISFCPSGSVQLSFANGGLSYKWYKDNVYIMETGLTYNATTAGDYKVGATNGDGIETFSNVITVSINALPVAPTANANTFIYDKTLKTATVTLPGAATAVWYTAETGGSVTSAPTGTNVGTYTAWAASLENGCESAARTLVTLTINKKVLTYTLSASNKVYDSFTPTTGTVTLTNLEAGDVVTATGTFAFATASVGVAKVVNVTGLTLDGVAMGNYSIVASSTTTANITAKPVTVTVTAGQTKVYGEANPVYAYTFAPALIGSDAFTGTLSRLVGENVGTYAINQGTLTLGGNYSITFVPANFAITAKPITVTATAGQTKVYGAVDPVFAYTFAPALIVPDAFAGALGRVAGENVGTYAINQGTLNLGANYAVTFVSADFSITAKPITVTVTAGQEKVYGAVDPVFAYIYNPALIGLDAFTGALVRSAGENVGTYAITQGTLALNANYVINFVGDNFAITAKPITVTADAAQTKVYGSADPVLTYSFAPALIGADAFTGTLSRVAGENVGTYAINQGTLSLGTNYNITFVSANFAISVKPVTVTVTAGQTKVYGDTDPTFAYTVAPALIGGDVFTGALARVAGEVVGTYAINQGTLSLGGNYNITFVGANFAITTKSVTVTVTAGAAQSKVFGTADPVFAYTFTPALIAPDVFTGSLTRVAGENVGTYAISQGTLALNANYTIAFVGANFTITPKPITVTVDAAQTKVYGTADPVFTYTFAPALLVPDVFVGALGRVAGENAGAYAINQGTLAINANYSINLVSANFTITAKPITVTVDAAQTKVYGEVDPTLTYTYAPALIGADAFTGIIARLAGEPVGTYAINQGTLSLGPNYNITFVGADFTITTKPVTVTVTAGQTKVYGAADPTFAYTSTALAFADAFTGALARVAGEPVGTYAINQGTLALGANYAITFVGANFAVTAKPITVTVTAGQTKVYGSADPVAYAYTSTPLAFAESFTGALARVAGESVGDYAINQGTLALSANYALTFVGANFTVTAKPVTVTVTAGQTKVYGSADPIAFAYTSTPLAFAESFTGALARAAGESVGTYAINQGTLALTPNYTITFVSSDYTITVKPITVTVTPGQTKVYGDADPLTFAYTSTPLAFADAFTGALARVAGEPVGTYAINQGTLALSANYSLTFVGSNFAVTAKPVTVTVTAGQTKVYGTADPLSFAYTSTPLAFAETFTGALVRVAGENFGNYAINQGTLALTSNYTLTFVGSTFAVAKKVLTVTADNNSRCQGIANPAFTFSYSGFVAGESMLNLTTEPTAATAANMASPAGNYPITLSGGVATNYSFNYVNANLTVLPLVSFTVQPVNASVSEGTNVTINTTVANATSFQWEISTDGIEWNNVSGGTTEDLNLGAVTVGMSGYQYRLSATGTCGSLTSNVITLTVVPSAPGTQATNIIWNYWSRTEINYKWTRGNGAGCIVVVKAGLADPVAPVNGTAYTANSIFKSGSKTDPANLDNETSSYVVYNGTGSTSAVTGLTRGTNYTFHVYEYNGSGAGTIYNTGAGASNNPATRRTSSKEVFDNGEIANTSDNFSIGEISPNPAVEALNFSVNANNSATYNVELFSLTGEKVIGATFELTAGQNQIYMPISSNISAGVYSLRVSDGIGFATKQVVVLP